MHPALEKIDELLERYKPEQIIATVEGRELDGIMEAQNADADPDDVLFLIDHRAYHEGVYIQRRNMPGWSVRGTGAQHYRRRGPDGKFVKDDD